MEITPGYMVREELQRDKMRGRAEGRAWGYEKRLSEGKGSELARKCWIEIKERCKEERTISEWEKERKKFFEDREFKIEEIEEGRERGEGGFEKVMEKEKERQKIERWDMIRNLSYNKWYNEIKGEGIPGYLKKGWGEDRWKRIARRLGNEVRESRYWEGEEKKRCRVCEGDIETWEHIWENCQRKREADGKRIWDGC